MIKFSCELCSESLNIFTLNRLCDTCYKIKNLIRIYGKENILKNLDNNFVIDVTKIEKDFTYKIKYNKDKKKDKDKKIDKPTIEYGLNLE